MFVARRMHRRVVTVFPGDSLQTARERMRSRNVRQLPVTDDDGTLVGILSDRDIREAMIPYQLLPGTSREEMERLLSETAVEKIMTRKVVTAMVYDALEDAIVLLHDFRINALPVVDDRGRLAGILTRGDVLKACIEAMGVGEISSRLEILVPDRPGSLAEVVEIIKSFHVNIITVLTTGHATEGMRAIYFRVNTQNIAPIRKAIEEAGFGILDPGSYLP